MPEKLLTLKELALHLEIDEVEIRRLADIGVIPAYRVGGSFLRFRKEQVDAIKDEIVRKSGKISTLPFSSKQEIPKDDKSKAFRGDRTTLKKAPESMGDKVCDFFYFNDFYIVCIAIIAALLYFITKM